MKMDQLEIFVALVESKTIQDAANLLSKTQPAVSMALKKLEASLGFELFDRSQYRMQLTAKGKAFYNKSLIIVDQIKQLKNYSLELQQQQELEITIAIEDIVISDKIYQSLQKLQSQFPNVVMNIITESRLRSLQKLARGEIDFAISPWIVSFAAEGDFSSKLLDTFDINFCIHKDLAKSIGIESSDEITQSHLMQLPQLIPADFAIKLTGIPLLHQLGNSIVRVNDYNSLNACLKAKLGWGPITSASWTDEMEKNFFRFSIDPKSSIQSSEIRLIKNRNQIFGPAKKELWEMF